MVDEIKCKQVYELLITPIVCTGYSNGKIDISNVGGIIKSTQTYYPYKKWNAPLDEDMSDFAMGFYEIVYKCLLSENKMLKDDNLYDTEFAGDTMNSFNYIANLFPEAGRSRNSRTPKSQWPIILQEWEQQYHCLANFWVIPLEIGRKNDNEFSKGSYENGINDYVDRFLDLISNPNYFKQIFSRDYNNIEEFAEKQFLFGSYLYGDLSVVSYSNETKTPDIMIKRIIDRIKIRASIIANSEYVEELWEYFHKWNLVRSETT